MAKLLLKFDGSKAGPDSNVGFELVDSTEWLALLAWLKLSLLRVNLVKRPMREKKAIRQLEVYTADLGVYEASECWPDYKGLLACIDTVEITDMEARVLSGLFTQRFGNVCLKYTLEKHLEKVKLFIRNNTESGRKDAYTD